MQRRRDLIRVVQTDITPRKGTCLLVTPRSGHLTAISSNHSLFDILVTMTMSVLINETSLSAWCLPTTGSFYTEKHRKKSVGLSEAGVHLV